MITRVGELKEILEKYKDEDMICLTNLTSCDHYDSKLIIKELGNGNEEEVFIDALYL